MIKTSAYAAMSPTSPLGPHTIVRREPKEKDVLIRIAYCGVCHSDIHQTRDEWGGSVFPMVPGHEIVGKVEQVGIMAEKFRVGDRVGVGVLVDSCRECDQCMSREEVYCKNWVSYTYNGYEQDRKTPTYGGYSTQIVVDETYVDRIPDGIPMERAAPLLCAGITTYSPIRHFGAKAGDSVGVVGLGGLGHMAVKFSKAFGATTTVLSHSPKKRESALKLGADDFIATDTPDAFQKNRMRFDFIIDAVSAAHDYNSYLELVKKDGTMALVGLPEPTMLRAQSVVNWRRKLTGSSAGGTKETQEMLDLCGEKGIGADVEVIPIQRVNEAYERTIRSDVQYRFVIDIDSLRK